MNTTQTYEALERYKSSIGLYYPLAVIQLRGGFRVSEVLKMKPSQIINTTDLYIESDKGSRAKRVHVPELEEFLTKWKMFGLTPFKGISRFQVYRMYKRLGLVVCNGVGKNDSVTHSMRKLYIKESHNSSNNIKVTRDIAGHKSTKSTEHYVGKQKD